MQRHKAEKMGESRLQFEKNYFSGRKYRSKETLVKRNVLEVIKWASRVSGKDFLLGTAKKALDVGCAFGFASAVLTSLGYETFGLDVSRWGVWQAKTVSGGSFVVCDAQALLPFKSDSFDLVTCFDVLEHLQFPEMAIRNMLESSRGALICTTPNRNVERPVRKIMGDFDETHVSVKSPSEWEKSIREVVGHEVVNVETFFDVTAKLANSRVLFKSVKLPRFGLTVRILVRK
jgi:2-polyprenyl-3-methyl-5-hydroxy-6-metoxy-1,4-benzoquinol methylase